MKLLKQIGQVLGLVQQVQNNDMNENYISGYDPYKPEPIFKNQHDVIPEYGFSKEFYDELHRFFGRGNRRSGRTYIMARLLLHTAIESGDKINIIDHFTIFNDTIYPNYNIANIIEKVVQTYKDAGLSINFKWIKKNESFVASLSGNIYINTQLYNRLKNEYYPLYFCSKPFLPEQVFDERKKLLLI